MQCNAIQRQLNQPYKSKYLRRLEQFRPNGKIALFMMIETGFALH